MRGGRLPTTSQQRREAHERQIREQEETAKAYNEFLATFQGEVSDDTAFTQHQQQLLHMSSKRSAFSDQYQPMHNDEHVSAPSNSRKRHIDTLLQDIRSKHSSSSESTNLYVGNLDPRVRIVLFSCLI
jgi:hypothetical protein